VLGHEVAFRFISTAFDCRRLRAVASVISGRFTAVQVKQDFADLEHIERVRGFYG
jgi:hypothetical protein